MGLAVGELIGAASFSESLDFRIGLGGRVTWLIVVEEGSKASAARRVSQSNGTTRRSQ